ncbi:MAG: bifunctional oligoribonuclease/PAP phosphatase NrnA [Candidatus Sigynarchaeum springense]
MIAESPEIVLISHENMDPDAVGSVVGIIGLIEGIAPERSLIKIFPPSVSKLSRKLLDTWQIALPFIQALPDSNFLPIMLDTQNVTTVIKDTNSGVDAIQMRSIIIDHHQNQGLPSRLCFIDSSVQANCEIVVNMYKALGKPLGFPINRALLAGILFDSSNLRYAKNITIQAVASLLDSGLDIEDFRGLMVENMDISERIARLKAGMRCNLLRVGDVIIASSAVSTFEASACRGLIGLGADISIVLAENKGDVRISARQTGECHKAYRINLAHVMHSISGTIGGTGGGHELAAAASGSKNGETGLKEAIKAIEDIINAGTRSQ